MKKKTALDFNRLSAVDFLRQEKHPVVLVLDNIRSAHNVGAAFRLSDALLIGHIYLCGITPCPPHKQLHKTALGAEEVVAWTHTQDTLEVLKELRKQGYQLIAVEQAKEAILLQHLHKITTKGPFALVFGHEVFGVDEKVLAAVDHCVEIPQYGTKFSMNVSVCMGMVVWELLRNRL